jgi:hypothetical protein
MINNRLSLHVGCTSFGSYNSIDRFFFVRFFMYVLRALLHEINEKTCTSTLTDFTPFVVHQGLNFYQRINLKYFSLSLLFQIHSDP